VIVFFTWLGIALVSLGIYIFRLWKKNRKRSRFQAKLTILFLLFVLVPTVPLTFFLANLFTRSADLLIIPGIGDALNTSLETIRFQVEERGRTFFTQYPNPEVWKITHLQEQNICSAARYRSAGGSILSDITLVNSSEMFAGLHSPSLESLRDGAVMHSTSTFYSSGDRQLIAVFHSYPDSSFGMAAYPLSPSIIEARDKITQALRIYGTLSYIKESIIQKNIIWGVAVLLIFGLVFLSIVVAKRVSRGISEPIQNLVQGIQRISENQWDYRVETKARDEFKLLVDSFNSMVRDLDVSRKKLVKAEKIAAWQEVARRISHEIKNSLTPISLSLHRLQKYFQETSIPQNISDSLKAVEDELVSLQNMAAEFSEFARMPRPMKVSLDINETVRTAVRLLEPSIGQVKIVTEYGADLPLIEADQEQIKRVLTNLIKNSVEASHDRGTITVKTRISGSDRYRIELEIGDEGDGMDDETLSKIFNAYFTTKRKGTGLGLAIVQKIIEDHNGEITVESAQDKGTRIRITI
jgi:nitrogen fixation/metabolism regulation signal transduction histidine kinase